MLTTAPELRPYSALRVELSTLNSCTVLIEGWNVIWFWTWSFRLIPLIMKLTVSSRLPAVLKANEPWPRRGAVRKPVAGCGATEPGMSSPRSTKWRPLSGISCTVRWSITCPTDVVVLSIDRGLPDDGHLLGDAADGQPHVLHRRSGRPPGGGRSTTCAWKPVGPHLEPVEADRERGQLVLAPGLSDTAVLSSPVAWLRSRILAPGDRGALIVGDRAAEAGRRLGESGHGRGEQRERAPDRRQLESLGEHGTSLQNRGSVAVRKWGSSMQRRVRLRSRAVNGEFDIHNRRKGVTNLVIRPPFGSVNLVR